MGEVFKLYTQEEVDRFIAKSVSEVRKKTKVKWNKAIKSIKIVATSITLFIMVLTVLITLGIIEGNNIQKDKVAYDDYSSEAVAVVDEAYEGSVNFFNGNVNSAYNAREIASHIVENRATFDITMFQIYDKVKSTSNFSDTEVRTTMNDIIAIIKDITKGENSISYSDFESYVISLGFVNSEGKANYNDYSNYMRGVIVEVAQAQQAIAQAEEDHGIGGR